MNNSEKTDFSTFTNILQSFFVSKSNKDLNLKKIAELSKPSEKNISDICSYKSNHESINEETTFSDDSESDSDSVSKPNTKTQSEESNYIDFKPKKFLMNYSNLTKNHIYIINKDFDDNTFILTDILKNISLMSNVTDTYNDKSYIITDKNNQIFYKNIILENPDLYFTTYFNLQQSKIEELSENKKKTIIVIDIDTIQEKEYLKLVDVLISLKTNVQFIFITTNISINKKLPKTLVIHSHDSKKSFQKDFYTKIIKPTIKQFENTEFDNYYNFVNQEIFAVRYIFLHNNEFKYC